MVIRHACFISYRHTKDAVGEHLTRELHDALRRELAAHTTKDIFFDQEGLRAGDLYNNAIAQALCRSACMLVVYTPTYFDRSALYCAREYRAMEQLEEQRLGGRQLAQRGLIIPIVLRGFGRLPAYIRNSRLCHSFEDYTLYKPKLTAYKAYMKAIRDVAEYIADRCHDIEQANPHCCTECDQFTLPTEKDIGHWVAGLITDPPPFPMSKAS